ncbi:hypothetical protein TSO221_01780 [Azospirillum sp. TSO22-1]|nr:hypothetical protein TSO221_01780 [Azospirillum sp. TSO22-1]
MKTACNEFLTRSRFAVDQYIRFGFCESNQRGAQTLHCGAAPDDTHFERIGTIQCITQGAVFQNEAAMIKRASDGFNQMVRVCRLLNEVISSLSDRANRHRDITVPGDHQHRKLRIDRPDLV